MPLMVVSYLTNARNGFKQGGRGGVLTAKEPSFEIPEVNDLIHKGGLVNLCGKAFDLEAVFLDLFVLGPLQPPIRYKESDLLKLPCIQPDAMPAALIYDDPGDAGKVFPVHHLMTADAGDIGYGLRQGRMERPVREVFLPIDIGLPRGPAKPPPVKP